MRINGRKRKRYAGVMMLLGLLCAPWMMSQSLSTSGSGYPKKIAVGMDTVIAISQRQMEVINSIKIERDELLEITQAIEGQIALGEMQVRTMEKEIALLREELVLWQEAQRASGALQAETERALKASEVMVKTYRRQRNLFAGASGVLGILLVVAVL
jgi:hypothetical protein